MPRFGDLLLYRRRRPTSAGYGCNVVDGLLEA